MKIIYVRTFRLAVLVLCAVLLPVGHLFAGAQVTFDNTTGGSSVNFVYTATDVTASPNYTYSSFTYTVAAGQTHVFTESPDGFPNYITVGHTVQINCTASGGGGVQSFSFTSGTTGGPFTIYGNGPPPGHTNITVCVQNTTSGNVNAYWNATGDNLQGGPQYFSETLGPGQTDCRTFTLVLPLDGTDNISSGWTPLDNNNGAVDPTSQNPFGTNADTTTTWTNGSSGFGGTNTIATGGSASGNGGGGNTYNYSTNINYGVGGTNLALDSTLRSGFGQIHADNLNVINGESVLHNDASQLHNDNISLNNEIVSVTNLLGQIVQYTWKTGTNTDQLPTLVSVITNNAGQNAQTIKAALQALPTTNTDVAAVNQLVLINSNLIQLDANLTNQSTSLTNIFASATDITNADLATETTQKGMSNMLAQIAANTGVFTNTGTSTNFNSSYQSMLGQVPGSATNASAAIAAADGAQGDYGVAGVISQLTPSLPPDSVSPVPMTMAFCGTIIDLDPVHMFPSVSVFSLAAFKVVALLLFLIDMGRMYWDVLKIRASTSTGGVPDLEAGGGIFSLGISGNLAGLIVAIIVPFVFIGIFAGCMAYLFSHMGISIADAMNASTFSTTMGATAYYLLSSFIPVNLLFSLICTRITLVFSLGKLVGLATAAARFLFGK